MPVRLGGVSKQARGNHRPKFRPTDDDTLRHGTAGVGRAISAAMRLIPIGTVEDAVLGRIDRVEATERFRAAMEPAQEQIERAIYRAYIDEQAHMTARIRNEVNADLRRAGSPVRLHDPADIAKAATVKLPWTVDMPNFNRVSEAAPARIYARGQAAGILSRLALDEQRVVFDQVTRAFTDTQVFSTGRQVVGRTVEQTARSILPVLAATTGAQMNLSPAEVALYRSRYTNGLFPKWAQAVNRFADTQAGVLAGKGVTGARAQILLDKRTQAYSDKLRRSRARMIARTEVNLAQNRAQLDTMLDAQRRGLVGSDARKEWVTGPFDVCPICTALGGTQVRVTESFPNVGDSPPAHPNCRCIVRLVPNLGRAPVRIGSGTPDDPIRYRFNDGWEAPVTPVAGFG